MDKLSVRSCMLCEMDLKDALSVVHPDCVPFDKLIMLCNCGDVSFQEDEFIGEMVEYLNVTMKEQNAELLKSHGGQFLIVSECSRCNGDKDGQDFQIIYVYQRQSEAN